MTEEYYVEPCEFTCAKKFLDALDETSEFWRGETWLYRGQNKDRALLPTALRPFKIIDEYAGTSCAPHIQQWLQERYAITWIRSAFDERMHSWKEHERYTELVQVLLRNAEALSSSELGRIQSEECVFGLFQAHYLWSIRHGMAERFLIKAFVELADRVGLSVPLDSFDHVWNKPLRFTDQIEQSVNSGRSVTVLNLEECLSVAYALARHHRVPTRLLDFTFRPLVAAFFAAYAEDGSGEDLDRRIVVWAVNQNALRDTDLKVVKHRRAEIGFLQAQDGAFLLDTMANEKFWLVGKWIPFDFYLRELVENEMAYKLILPFSEHGKLLHLLALKGVSMPDLMPSFDNVANEIQDNRFNLIDFVFQKS